MREINLLKSLPLTKRNVELRSFEKSDYTIKIAKEFGKDYFDGDRKFGYGGYYYDGRWKKVAEDIINFYNLKPKMKVLDVGCAKGFLVKDLIQACPGLEVYGLDVSEYAINNCEDLVKDRLYIANALDIPFPNDTFDCVLSINTIHNLSRNLVKVALTEMIRVSKGNIFVQVDSYQNHEQKKLFEKWVLTAEFHDYPEKWIEVFNEVGYKGDYFWTIVD